MSDRRNPEGRRTPRRAFSHPVGILYHGEYKLRQGVQLSEGGMLFGSTEQFSTNDQIVACLVMPGRASVVARGEIVYGRPGENGLTLYGVKFTSLQLNQRRQIRNYVTAKTEREAEAEGEEADLWGPSRNRLPS